LHSDVHLIGNHISPGYIFKIEEIVISRHYPYRQPFGIILCLLR
jgi:hypothetical protein